MKFKRIKDLREDNDKLQKEIAKLLGISQQYYSENRTIPITHLITLAKYYNTSKYLFAKNMPVKLYRKCVIRCL